MIYLQKNTKQSILKRMLILFFLLISININSQKIKTILFLKNADSIIGYSKGINYSNIQFSKERKGKYKKIDIKEIEKVILYSKKGKKEYHHLYVQKKRGVDEFFALLISEGPINHYLYSSYYSFINHISTDVTGNAMNSSRSANITSHSVNINYLKKENEKQSFLISDVYWSLFGEKYFRKKASVFFKDCPTLIKKIKTKEFKKSDLVEIIEFYNTKCN